MHILIWVLAALALGCWTLLAWATAWVLGLDPGVIGNLAANIGSMPGAAWLDLWIPGWQPLAVATLEITRDVFAALGSIGSWLVWAAWGLGALLIVGCAVLGSLAVGLVRRATRPATPLPGRA
ncbi:MAG: hypothetical protein KA711_00765 [Ideonella sp. WA131b]|jgi:hypothetical protein|nr:hypothetical protein [Ideonella sp. WA131b]